MMKLITSFFVLLLLIGAFSAAAQESQCLEVWDYWSGDNIRHEVNLDTGTVVSYPPATPVYTSSYSPDNESFDGRYSAQLEQNEWLGEGFRLTLIDNTVGVSFLLEEYATAVSWSPNSARLAYLQIIGENAAALVLFNADGGETISIPLSAVSGLYLASIFWSQDGSQIIVSIYLEDSPAMLAIQFYRVTDLALLNSYETQIYSPSYFWSPSRRYFLVYGSSEGGMLVDTQLQQAYAVHTDGLYMHHFYWSPNENYLVDAHVNNDWTDVFDVVNMQGEYLLENILINAHYDGSSARVQWIDEHRLIANTFGFERAITSLSLFNLQTGKQQLLLSHLAIYGISHDQRYVAATESSQDTTIQFFDLATAEITVEKLRVSSNIDNFIWRDDRLELIVLFQDRSLRGYDNGTGTWRDIATLPGEENMLRLIPCVH